MPRKRVFTSAKQVKINKANKTKLPIIQVQRRSILVLISSSYKNWITDTTTRWRRIIVHAIKAKEQAQIILDNYYKSKDKFDVVVLSPAHGAKTSTKISWSVLADYVPILSWDIRSLGDKFFKATIWIGVKHQFQFSFVSLWPLCQERTNAYLQWVGQEEAHGLL